MTSSSQEYTLLMNYLNYIRDQRALFDNIVATSGNTSNRLDLLMTAFLENRYYRRRPATRTYRRTLSRPPPLTTPPPPPPPPPFPPLSTTIPVNFFDPITVRPTNEQITAATTVTAFRDISSNQTICPISRETFVDDDTVMQINHCHHVFREASLRNWFANSTLCPVCRHDIRNTESFNNLVSNISNILTNTFADPSRNSVSFNIPFTY